MMISKYNSCLLFCFFVELKNGLYDMEVVVLEGYNFFTYYMIKFLLWVILFWKKIEVF